VLVLDVPGDVDRVVTVDEDPRSAPWTDVLAHDVTRTIPRRAKDPPSARRQ